VSTAPRVGVVGHVEWVDFAVVDSLPAPGEVVHAREVFGAPGGAGAVAAVQLRRLAEAVSLFCALGDDELAGRSRAGLEALGVEVHGAARARPQRRCFCHAEAGGERTITVLGERIVPHGADPLPWERLGELDAVFFTAGDADAARAARAARLLVATPRALGPLAEAGVAVDVLVASAADAREAAAARKLAAGVLVLTSGGRGGSWSGDDGTAGRWDAVAPPAPPVDAYGCGDSFAAGLTFGLASGLELDEAVALGARCGAWCLAGRGPYGRQLTAREL
jgi:ribokinase